jgi:hypothetical protein
VQPTTATTSRVAARDRLRRRTRWLSSVTTLATLAATGAVTGLLARPTAAAAGAEPVPTAAAELEPAPLPQPLRTVYVRQSEPRRQGQAVRQQQPAPRRTAVRAPAPRRTSAPAVITSSGS